MAGHSHNDGDGEMGTAGAQFCDQDMQSFSRFRHECREAFNKSALGFTDVYRLVGITNYEAMLTGLWGSIQNLAKAQQFHISAVPNGSGVNVYYRESYGRKGWSPLPAPLIPSQAWDTLFVHPTDPVLQGIL